MEKWGLFCIRPSKEPNKNTSQWICIVLYAAATVKKGGEDKVLLGYLFLNFYAFAFMLYSEKFAEKYGILSKEIQPRETPRVGNNLSRSSSK